MFRKVAAKVRQILDIINGADALLRAATLVRGTEALSLHHRDWLLLTHPRYLDPRALAPFGYRVYSQSDEDGILHEIFARLGIATGTFAELGVEDGMETNTSALLHEGWSGVWLEVSSTCAATIRNNFRVPLADGRLQLRECFITAENIEELLTSEGVIPELTLLSVDIDGNDFWIWRAIETVHPPVVVVEYNGDFGPSLEWVIPYDPSHRFSGTRYYGASLKALERLGREKGYSLVGCNFYGMNAFFVRDDLVRDKFLVPFTAEFHFEPPRHYMRPRGGWGKDPREFASVQPPRWPA